MKFLQGAYRPTNVTLAYLEPAHVEEELQKGEQRKVKVADEAVVEVSTSYQAGQHKYVHRYCRHLHSPSTANPVSAPINQYQGYGPRIFFKAICVW